MNTKPPLAAIPARLGNLAISGLLCALYLCLVGCGYEESRDPPALEIQISEVMVLGQQQSVSEEALLGGPQAVRTDQQGRIYVADHEYMGVKVFGSSGKYLRTIGTRGNGPGEFGRISAITVTNDDQLVVLDWFNRRATTFTPEGSVVSSTMLDTTSVRWPRDVQQLPGGEFLVLSHTRRDPHIIHAADENFREQSSFARYQDTWRGREAFGKHASYFRPGHFWPHGDKYILYVPHLYAGTIYRYRRETNGWNLADSLEGFVEQRRPYSPLDTEPPGEDDAPDIHTLHLDGETHIARIHNRSEGIFTLQDGRIVHFSTIRRSSGRHLGVEVFSPEGELIGYRQIDRFDRREQPGREPPIEICWKDRRDRFYIIDYRSFPVVRVVNLHISIDAK